MKGVLIYICSFLSITCVFSQEHVQSKDSMYVMGICDIHGYCIPTLNGLPRPKAIEVNYTRVLGFDIATKYEGSDEKFRNTIDNNRRTNIKLKVPLVLKNNLKISLGFDYETEEFKFENEETIDNAFQNYLNDRDLQKIGTKLYILKPFKGNHYLASRFTYGLNSDSRDKSYREQSRASFTLIYGKKVSQNISWGYGLSYSNAFGRQAVYPVFAYNKILNKKWNIDLLLPVMVRFKYMPNDKNIFTITPRIEGDKYYITINEHVPEKLYFEKASINVSLAYEREVYDFFWITVGVGARKNINFRLSQKNSFLERTAPLITNDIKDALLIKAGIFMVPPRKWFDKKKKMLEQ